MKSAALLIFSLAAAGASAAPASPAIPDKPDASAPSRFSRIGDDYRKVEVLSDTFFNPFKVQATVELPMDKSGAKVTDETITDAVEHRGVSGLLIAASPDANRIIIGDQVFAVGDELTFYDTGKETDIALVSGVRVVLREIGRDRLALDVGPEGETLHRINFPLRSFWRP